MRFGVWSETSDFLREARCRVRWSSTGLSRGTYIVPESTRLLSPLLHAEADQRCRFNWRLRKSAGDSNRAFRPSVAAYAVAARAMSSYRTATPCPE